MIFAKDDNHATEIVDIAKNVFKPEFENDAIPEKFVQKITYSVGDSNALIRDLRTEKDFRIAVTVTLVATGTDVKPLEVVLFMKDVHSDVLYTQMKGRGCRVISDDKLKEVTPNADTKECYYIVDAVGVTESEKHVPKPGPDGSGKKNLSLEHLLERLAHNEVSDETVLYGSASELRATLDYDFAEEKKFSYKNLSMEEIIHHLAIFISRLWQIHVFGEGNTRTTAVFFIKYLRTLGFDVTNDIFAENAWYFRNALVRANYNDLKNGVHETTEYLELFLRNLLLDEKNELHNRTMHISGRFAEVDIERVKVDIESGEVDIESTKVDIRNKLLSFSDTISEKTINHTVEIFSKCGKENCFGRTIVEEITGLKPSGASKLIKLLVDSEVIVPVTGHGKGKYRFQ